MGLAPIAGVVVVGALDLITSDASMAAQIFFHLPSALRASQLSMAGEIAVVFHVPEPGGSAQRRIATVVRNLQRPAAPPFEATCVHACM